MKSYFIIKHREVWFKRKTATTDYECQHSNYILPLTRPDTGNCRMTMYDELWWMWKEAVVAYLKRTLLSRNVLTDRGKHKPHSGQAVSETAFWHSVLNMVTTIPRENVTESHFKNHPAVPNAWHSYIFLHRSIHLSVCISRLILKH
jgi:hypothetical protein